MKLLERLRGWRLRARPDHSPDHAGEEPPLGEDEDPFDAPVVLEIRDEIDLHAIPPKQVRAVVEAYLVEARARGFRRVRLIHGKGIGVQREIVRAQLARTPFVRAWRDAPADAGGPGATIAELEPERPDVEIRASVE